MFWMKELYKWAGGELGKTQILWGPIFKRQIDQDFECLHRRGNSDQVDEPPPNRKISHA